MSFEQCIGTRPLQGETLGDWGFWLEALSPYRAVAGLAPES